MALPAHYARVLVLFSNSTAKININVLWYILPTAPVDPENAAVELRDNAVDAFNGPITAWMTSTCHFIGVSVFLTTGGITFDSHSVGGFAAGTLAGDTCPAFVAALIRKRTGTGGKSGRGRWYVPCVAEINTAGDLLTAPGLAALNEIATAYETDLPADSTVCHSAHHSQKLNTLTILTGLQAQQRLQTERRRLVR